VEKRAAECAAVASSSDALLDVTADCDLMRVVEAWPRLSGIIKGEILNLIDDPNEPLPLTEGRVPKGEK
jgi:hypothetical protein